MDDNVNTLTFSDADFPDTLRNIPSAPKRLYYCGLAVAEWINQPKVAIVGSRKMTEYGRHATSKISAGLAQAGVVIISGLAYGIDITAHKAALDSSGTTIAVLGTGLDDIYPAEHQQIAKRITQQGGLITEYPAGTPGLPGYFVARNRLISGLCDVLLVTEAALKSGSLHTARFALEQGKTVMAVPGNIDNPGSEGCNNLIKSGAIPVTSVDDIFFALNLPPPKNQSRTPFKGTAEETRVISLLKEGSLDQENLAMAAGLDVATLASTLTSLELSGHIRPAGAGNWTLA